MPLRHMMTTTASTTRNPAISGGKIGAPVTNLTGLKIAPLMLSNTQSQSALMVRQAIGLEGTLTQIWETYTESHAHTDSGTSVTQLPDIKTGDRLVIDSTTYTVRLADQQPATTSFPVTLIIFVTDDRDA